MALTIIALEKAGRKSSGWNGDHGKIAHALEVKDGQRERDLEGGTTAALCGAAPSGRGSWSSHQSEAVTCPKCLKKLASAVALN
ncbi:hypothetical protein [Massilia sp. CCM 8734]|uniref:hypothetical protein n=1 Tax=Massilia sp. CCM 8734 TaxID=2609283 RepID=UPI0014233B43|nr:hypothetical protein [Massilia sp. CCM 8734]NHZ99114.1 hypothetical protein [Massilia sp. CCM 8734]